jgi:hypothetical protein
MDFSILSKLGHKPNNRLISFSQFDMYTSCPHKWKLRYVDGIKDSDQNSIHFVFGTALHLVIQSYLKQIFTDSAKNADKRNLGDELEVEMIKDVSERLKKSEDTSWTSPEQLTEFHKDGIEILDYLKKNRRKYFSNRTEVYIGEEIPLYSKLLDEYEVFFMGFIDFAVGTKLTNRVKLIDFKKSTRGWSDYEKKSNKIEQLRLYKILYSKYSGVPIEDIDIEFFVLKQKLNEWNMFPQKRVQIVTPSSGKVTLNRTFNKVATFITENFEKDGSFKKHERVKNPGIKNFNCTYCAFKDRFDLCKKEDRTAVDLG